MCAFIYGPWCKSVEQVMVQRHLPSPLFGRRTTTTTTDDDDGRRMRDDGRRATMTDDGRR